MFKTIIKQVRQSPDGQCLRESSRKCCSLPMDKFLELLMNFICVTLEVSQQPMGWLKFELGFTRRLVLLRGGRATPM